MPGLVDQIIGDKMAGIKMNNDGLSFAFENDPAAPATFTTGGVYRQVETGSVSRGQGG